MIAKTIRFKVVLLLSFSLPAAAFPTNISAKNFDLSNTIPQYTRSLNAQPLDYQLVSKQQFDHLSIQRYQLHSQTWSPQSVVTPAQWQHEVSIYIPEHAKSKNALVVINNGTNNDGQGNSIAATNFGEDRLQRIARTTQTIVISINNIPNQKLNYQNGQSLAEDDSVAYTWKLFLNDAGKFQNVPLHIPMTAAVSQSLRLAKQELKPWRIHQFIVTGASKRAWAAWLSAISNPDVVAIVPFVIDLLNTQQSLQHMYRSYGNHWPIAFAPYYLQSIDQRINTPPFTRLMQIEDPLAYLNTPYGHRLNIEKYLINASGDDFYVPDNSHFYYPYLPENKSLRVVPNSTHGGILSVSEQSLIGFVRRFQQGTRLPRIDEKRINTKNGQSRLVFRLSERPIRVVQWTAYNPDARDFRYTCGVRYLPTTLNITSSNNGQIALNIPQRGWQATFVEATFRDGYVATTQVYITPNQYPITAPKSQGGACQTLEGRGLIENG